MILKDYDIILRTAEQTRKGWDGTFQKLAEDQDDQLIDEEFEALSQWKKIEWT